MPLEAEDITKVLNYCKRDLSQEYKFFLDTFDFISDKDLQEQLAQEFYSSRYIYKLMEALNLSGHELYAHVKFQIIQYASIYEAVICYLLWNKYADHDALRKIEFHKEYRKVEALSKPTKILFGEEECVICVSRSVKTPPPSIKFDDKVNASVEIGFINIKYAEEIKNFYKLRNLVHIEKASKSEIDFEIGQARLSYLRMEPFIKDIKEFIKTNSSN
jgi:hypothetical protein